MKRLALLMLAALPLIGCGQSVSTPPDFSGNWSGSVMVAGGESGTLSVNMAQNGDSLTGTWSLRVKGSALGNGGSVSGEISGNGSRLTLLGTAQSCTFDATALLDRTTLRGTVLVKSCPVAGNTVQGGIFAASRR